MNHAAIRQPNGRSSPSRVDDTDLDDADFELQHVTWGSPRASRFTPGDTHRSSTASSAAPSSVRQGITPSPSMDQASANEQLMVASPTVGHNLMWPESPRAGAAFAAIHRAAIHPLHLSLQQRRQLLRDYLQLRLRNKENDIACGLVQDRLDQLETGEIAAHRKSLRQSFDGFSHLLPR